MYARLFSSLHTTSSLSACRAHHHCDSPQIHLRTGQPCTLARAELCDRPPADVDVDVDDVDDVDDIVDVVGIAASLPPLTSAAAEVDARSGAARRGDEMPGGRSIPSPVPVPVPVPVLLLLLTVMETFGRGCDGALVMAAVAAAVVVAAVVVAVVTAD